MPLVGRRVILSCRLQNKQPGIMSDTDCRKLILNWPQVQQRFSDTRGSPTNDSVTVQNGCGSKPNGVVFFVLCFFHCWLLGFLAFRLLGFLAFWLLAFRHLVGYRFSHPLHSQLGGLLASAGLCGFWRLWLCASSALPVPLRAVWLLHLFIDFWIWLPAASSASPVPPYLNHHFFDHHGGDSTPPQPIRFFLDCLQSNCTPI